MYTTDILVIGAGIAGLTTAIKLAEARTDLKITVFTKTTSRETNTKYAQGGVAAVWNHQIDSYNKHIEDTLDAGDGLCDPDVVSFVVKEGPDRVQELIDWGARFDKNSGSDSYNLGREGGHSENRILHFKDLTGWEMQRTLSDKAATLPNIEIHEHFFCYRFNYAASLGAQCHSVARRYKMLWCLRIGHLHE